MGREVAMIMGRALGVIKVVGRPLLMVRRGLVVLLDAPVPLFIPFLRKGRMGRKSAMSAIIMKSAPPMATFISIMCAAPAFPLFSLTNSFAHPSFLVQTLDERVVETTAATTAANTAFTRTAMASSSLTEQELSTLQMLRGANEQTMLSVMRMLEATSAEAKEEPKAEATTGAMPWLPVVKPTYPNGDNRQVVDVGGKPTPVLHFAEKMGLREPLELESEVHWYHKFGVQFRTG